jgi:TRAP-type C4-dicarboxylate transport system permease small subunit
MRFIKLIEHIFSSIFEWIGITLVAALIGVVFLGILDRFMLLIGWSWPEELARFILTWLAFVAFSLCVQKSMHYKVEYLIGKIAHRKSAVYLELIVLFVCISIIFIVGIKGLFFALDARNQIAAALRIPMSFIYSVIPISCILMLFFLANKVIDKIRILLNRSESQQ